MDKRIIRLAEAKNLSGLSRSSIYALMNEGKFPQKVSIGSRAIGWVENEIQDWIEERVSTRPSKGVN